MFSYQKKSPRTAHRDIYFELSHHGKKNKDGILAYIVNKTKKEGIEKINAQCIPTSKSLPCQNFLPDFGFKNEDDHYTMLLNYDVKFLNISN